MFLCQVYIYGDVSVFSTILHCNGNVKMLFRSLILDIGRIGGHLATIFCVIVYGSSNLSINQYIK